MVTGGSSGIGAALARKLASHGWHCVLLARGEERLRAVASEIGGEHEICDVGDREQVAAVAARVLERHPRLALLANVAGIPGRTDFLEISAERLEDVTRTNYLGSVWCVRSFLGGLEAAPRAHVVNVVSVAGVVALAPAGPYTASKHAQLAFSRAVTAALAGRGIRVHTVLPGFVETEGFPQRSTLRSPVLRRLVIEPDRVADVVLRALATGRAETWVPRWYRAAALVQAAAPGLVRRAAARGRYRRTPKTP